MINGIQLKVCGITRRIDAESANLIGADYLGFNLYPKSPRYTPLEKFEELSARLPQRRKVAIMVRPTVEELAAAKEAGFDFFQVHFDPESDRRRVESWVPVVGKDRLWLAPRLPPDQSFPEWLLPLADTFLIDTFREDSYAAWAAGVCLVAARYLCLHPAFGGTPLPAGQVSGADRPPQCLYCLVGRIWTYSIPSGAELLAGSGRLPTD